MSFPAALEGVRILELSGGLAGRTAGALLADLGAEVIQFPADGSAPSVGDPGRVWADRRKTVLGVGQTDGERLVGMRRLLDGADIFLSDLPPGGLERLGLDPVTARSRHPRLVHVWTPPFGTTGRWSYLEGDPLLLAAVSGFADQIPALEDRPVAPAVPTFLYLHGAMAAAAALAGLVGREESGVGSEVCVTGLDATGAALATLMMYGFDVPGLPSYGRGLRGVPNFRLYQGSDGAWFFLAALTPGIFLRALDAVDRMDIMVRDDVEGEFANLTGVAREAVQAEMERTMSERTAAEWIEILRAADVPVAPVWTREQWLETQIVPAAARTIFEHPEFGTLTVPVPPVDLAESPMASGGAGPAGPSEQWISADPANSVGSRRNEPGHGDQEQPAPLLPGREEPIRPLTGIKVIDACSFLAGPFVSALLADFGAEVIKVEPAEGDPYGVFVVSHAIVNQAKRIVLMDLGDADGRASFLKLLAGADLLVENFMPDSLVRLDLGPDVIQGAAPDLVRCSISAFGPDNAWTGTPGFDPVLQVMTGLATAQGGSDRPLQLSAPVVDISTGALGAVGSLAALFHRTRSGRAQRLTTSLASGAVFVQSAEMTTYPSRPLPAAGVVDFLGPTPTRRFYQTADGWIAVAVAEGRDPGPLLQCVGLPSTHPLSYRSGPYDGELERRLLEWPSARWLDEFALAGVSAVDAVRRAVGIRDPYLTANGFSHLLDVPGLGRYRVVGAYSRWNGSRNEAGCYPVRGLDTVEILTEAGVDRDVIDGMLSRGAISVPG